MSYFRLFSMAATDVPTPPAGKFSFFFDSANGDEPSYKNSAGVVTSLIGAAGMANPMTTAGDLIVGGASGTPTRLAAGSTAGHVLTSNGSGAAPSYQAPSGAVSSVNSQTGAVSLDAADIPITDAGGYFTSTNVEGALQELGAGTGGGGGYGNTVVQTITGTTYTATAADGGNSATSPSRFNVFTNTSAKSATFDPESTTALPANGEWYFYNQGASNLTIIPGSGVTIIRPGGGALVVASGDAVVVKRLAADSFLVLP